LRKYPSLIFGVVRWQFNLL